MNTPTKAMWARPPERDVFWPGTCTQRIAFIERQVKHAPAWLNEWDVRLLAAKEWETR